MKIVKEPRAANGASLIEKVATGEFFDDSSETQTRQRRIHHGLCFLAGFHQRQTQLAAAQAQLLHSILAGNGAHFVEQRVVQRLRILQ